MPHQDEFLQYQMDAAIDEEWERRTIVAIAYVAAFKKTMNKLLPSSDRFKLGVEEIKEEGMDDIIYRFVLADNETKGACQFVEAFSRITHEPPACVPPEEAAERLWLHGLSIFNGKDQSDD